MVDGHITAEEMERFCAGALPAGRVIACSAHLDECPRCRLLCDSTSKTVRHARPLFIDFSSDAWPVGDHPEYEELADYAAGELDEEDGEIIQGHLENCERCRREVADFKDFIRAVEPEMAVEFKPEGPYLRAIRGLRRGLRPTFFSPVPTAIFALLLAAASALVLLNFSRVRQDTIGQQVDPNTPPADHSFTPAITPTPGPTGSNGQGAAEREAAGIPRLRAGDDDGGRAHGVDSRGRPYGMDRLPQSVRRLVASALLGKGPEKPEILGRLMTRSVTYRGSGDSLTLPVTASPDGTVILTERPILSWKSGSQAEAYRVVVADLRFNSVAESPWVEETSWQVPVALERGEEYLWQVRGRRDGGEAEGDLVVEARFKVIEAEGAKRIAAMRRTIGSPFVRGVILAREGVIEEAERELREAGRHSPPARRLLSQINSWRRPGP